MFLFRWLITLFSVALAALAGNWVGWQLQALRTGESARTLSFASKNEEGETVIAVNLAITQFVPAALFGFMGRPRWLFAFIGGILASGLEEDEDGKRVWFWS